MLNEELSFNDKAESAYVRVVLQSLKRILESYGYTMSDTLNDFHLLGRLWQTSDKDDLLRKLDGVFSLLEEQHIESVRKRHDEHLAGLRSQLEEVQRQYGQKQQEIESLRAQARKAGWSATLRTIAAITTVVFLLLVLLGCLWKGYQYGSKQAAHKAYGFFTKFIESLGWVKVMSIIGVISGVLTIFIAQWFQLFQRIHEDLLGRDSEAKEAITSNTLDNVSEDIGESS